MTDEDIITAVLAEEGGLVDNPADPGGITNFGITIPAYTDYLRSVTGNSSATANAEDIRSLNEPSARQFYSWLLQISRIGRIQNMAVRAVVFDIAVNVGTRQASKILQRALGVSDDGIIGSATLAAIPYLDGSKLIRLIAVEQMLFYGRLASGDLTDTDRDGIPDRLEFLPGWLNRLARKMRAVA